MAGEWREYRIGEIADVVGGSTPSTADPSNFDGSIPWLTPKDLAAPHNRYVTRGERNLSAKGLASCSARLLPPATVLLTTRAPIGYVAIAKNPLATNQGFRNLVPKAAVDSEYLYYWLKAHIEELERHASGSTFRELTGSSLAQIKLRIPPLPEQRAIAHILGTLDDKIELNRRMSETLEAMARALFKAWFVDFDPVRAKCRGGSCARPDQETQKQGAYIQGTHKGHPYEMPPDIANLFPDRLVPSELGEIPEGWKVQPLGELLEFAYGKALKAHSRQHGTVPVYGSNGQVGWHDEKLVTGPGIVVGRKGNPGIVTWSPTDFFPIDTTFYVVPKDDCSSLRFLFYALQTHDLASLGADSAVPGLNRNLAYMSKQVVPPALIQEKFDQKVCPFFDRIHQCEEESRTLAALRDALLPKLISGELRVKDAEKLVLQSLPNLNKED